MFSLKPKVKDQPEIEQILNFQPEGWWQNARRFLWEVSKVVVISVAIILPIRYFLIQPYYVKGASMEPNYYDHDYLIVDEISFRFRDPARGEVIVFRYPLDPRQYFIKRVIGLPEETVKIAGGRVYIYNKANPQGFELDEPYLNGAKTFTATGKNYEKVLGSEELFVMGDNRPASLDSRVFGTLPLKYIIGRTWVRGWPFDRLAIFAVPEYSN
ncbi:MAG: signal peptidase I [Candidatus Buchananbacteria bacterium]